MGDFADDLNGTNGYFEEDDHEYVDKEMCTSCGEIVPSENLIYDPESGHCKCTLCI